MKRTTAILCFLLLALTGSAQVVLKTIAPAKPVSAGESFRIQYYVEGAPVHELTPPDFSPFRLVEGPDIYPGKTPGTGLLSKNYIYTLMATRPGEYRIPGATLRTGNRFMQSGIARITVIANDQSAASVSNETGAPTGYYLQPGENAQEKIRQNLFLQVTTDKRTCFVGEPIQVTYKLYSRLESRSDIIKNPGFYGFTVHDMIGLPDQQVGIEKINGKDFDVHTIRKVQLYPMQAGRFTIDPMEIKNRVEFSTRVQYRKTQQRIAEGLLGEDQDEPAADGTRTVENQMRTASLVIEVKPLPEKNKPGDFNGAVGRFTLEARLEQKQLARNEEGFLVVTIEGKGNFVQISPPVIEWPAGIEGFSAVVTDSLDKLKIPLAGKRQFKYGFVCTSPGVYQLPAVRFTCFDTDSNRYRNLVSKALQVNVSQQEKKQVLNETQKKVSIDELSQQKSRIAVIVVFLLVAAVLAYWALKKKPVAGTPVQVKKEKPAIHASLAAASGLVSGEGGSFYEELHRSVWDYFDQYFSIAGTSRNKENLFGLLREKGVAEEDIRTLSAVLSDCETGMYTRAVPGKSNQELLEESRNLLEKMNGILF